MTSYSLPKSQTPTFLPLKSAGGDVSMPGWTLPGAHETERVPERWKTCAMSTRSDWPLSRSPSTLGTHAIVNSGPFGSEPTVWGDVRAAGDEVHLQALRRVVALPVGREVARELRLRAPTGAAG